jgi:hypothetical protein
MINGYPTYEELEQRILRQIGWRGKSNEVALLWRGYLSGLLEWGVIEISTYDALLKLLPAPGMIELYELFADEPTTPEQEKEILAAAERK